MTGRHGHIGEWGRELRREVGDGRGADGSLYLLPEQLMVWSRDLQSVLEGPLWLEGALVRCEQ